MICPVMMIFIANIFFFIMTVVIKYRRQRRKKNTKEIMLVCNFSVEERESEWREGGGRVSWNILECIISYMPFLYLLVLFTDTG